MAEDLGFTAGVRSAGAPDADVVVLDTIGELVAAYRLATLVFVGGSFTRRGGQNILEPAAHGKPVLFGPNMDNFHDSVQVLVGRGGIQVNDAEHLYRVAHDLLGRPEKIAELGRLARAAVSSIRGASARNVEHMAKLLAPRFTAQRRTEAS
jgi:3-deoxy-D-manno-octulosonic-acid transferase